MRRLMVCAALLFFVATAVAQDAKKPGVVPAGELKSVVPSTYFFRGQSATVQMRNAAAIRTKDGRYILAALVDTSGYASDVAQKYQGLFITEVKIKVEDSDLAAGAYGFGFTGDGKLVIADVGANDLLSAASKHDDQLKRAVPLKIVAEGENYRLYAGKKYVTISIP